ncbi:MAG: hypothetical protein JETCAE03_33000 [Ignavibacteriaceae bacterium]|jgi:hypothetical protein|nr:MAG: hypothetical protein JETCAE03_33000 [Ignavibacteriaceae bacterium]
MKKCKNCNKLIDDKKIFCNNSCSASFNNKKRKKCLYESIGKKISKSMKKFYSSEEGKKNKDKLKNLYVNKTYDEIYGKEKAKKIKKKLSKLNAGNKNHFFGKHHTTQTKQQISNNRKNKLTGSKNHMYGKPPPTGSGNGWSGWYKNWYFRSLLELSYMINVIERFNLKWESAEKRKYRINYVDYNGKNRTHFADFVLNNKYLVEIKPKNLFNTTNNTIIKEACINYCNQNNLIFKMIEPTKIKQEIVFNLYKNNEIKFIDRYVKKIEEKYAIMD